MARFCKDCKWPARGIFGGVDMFAKCLYPTEDRLRYDLVTGKPSDKDINAESCVLARHKLGGCGLEGKWFEPYK